MSRPLTDRDDTTHVHGIGCFDPHCTRPEHYPSKPAAPVQPGDRWGVWTIDLRGERPRVYRTRPFGQAGVVCSLSAAIDAAHRLAPFVDPYRCFGDESAFRAAKRAASQAAFTWDACRRAVAA